VINRRVINPNLSSDCDNDCENSETNSRSACKNSEIDNERSNTRPDVVNDMNLHSHCIVSSECFLLR
jgi:hypothetical protein